MYNKTPAAKHRLLRGAVQPLALHHIVCIEIVTLYFPVVFNNFIYNRVT